MTIATTSPEQRKQFKHIIIFDSVRAFEYMTISRKSVLQGIAHHDIIYRSTKDGFESVFFNMKPDGDFEEHNLSGSSGDEQDPSKLYVSMENECLRLEERFSEDEDETGLIDFIPLSEIHMIRFDAIPGATGNTDMDSILFRSRDDLKGRRR